MKLSTRYGRQETKTLPTTTMSVSVLMILLVSMIISSSSSSWFGGVNAMHATSSSTTTTLNPLIIKGTKFFDSVTEEEVVIRGVDYYPRPNAGHLNQNSLDLFTTQHSSIWKRDVRHLKDLGINAIRLYAVNASENHDEFMCAMEEAGIYVMVALAHDCPTCAVTKEEAPHCYPPELKEQGMAVIREFSRYPNTLAFSAGNEVNHFVPIGRPQWNAPCQKKFIADMRRYIASCSDGNNITGIDYGVGAMRKIPVGLVLADTDRRDNAMYYNCLDEKRSNATSSNEATTTQQHEALRGGDDDHNNYDLEGVHEFGFAEFYGINTYVDCNGTATTYDEFLGLNTLQEDFSSYNYSVPVLMTEFGCLSDTFPTVDGYEGQRSFLEARFLLERPELRDVFSGGFAFEYSTEAENAKAQSPFPFKKFGKQNYGLGYFSPENCDDINKPCGYKPFPSSKSLLDAFDPSRIANRTSISEYDPPTHRTGRSECPSSFPSIYSFTWKADTDISLNQCPNQEELRSYACPIPSSQYIRVIDQNLISKPRMIISVLGAVMLVAVVLMLTFRRRKSGKQGYDPISDEEYKYHETDSSSLSDEESDRHLVQDHSYLSSFQMSPSNTQI
jgi:1,3-beta-glucanosyltransferase GAS5